MQKTAVITGGNSGIGFMTARDLVAAGWRVIITGRDEARLGAAADVLGPNATWRAGDFGSLAKVRALAASLNAEPRIDVLLNNIGVSLSRQRKTVDGNDMMLQVNHLAPFLLTSLLLDKLKASAPARIINVASRAHMWANGAGFDDFQFEKAYSVRQAYARTKLYNILFTRELARRLAGTGVTVNAAHPGMIQTEIGRGGDLTGIASIVWPILQWWRGKPISEASRVTSYLATSSEMEGVTGQYVSTDLKAHEPSELARDDAAARRLWEMSEALVS
jgi:NAD(P)-dependent dehydrogenase (short-subunit alcohol dehydrogenase family)